jgi:hypothetical protein
MYPPPKKLTKIIEYDNTENGKRAAIFVVSFAPATLTGLRIQ